MSKIRENIRIALNMLLINKFRAVLTTIGIGIGIAAVIVLVSLGQAVQGYLTNQFLSVGSDLIYVRPVSSFRGGEGQAGRSGVSLSSLTDKDVQLLQNPDNVTNVKSVVPVVQTFRPADYGTNKASGRVTGTTAAYFDTLNRDLASGQLFDDQDVTSGNRVAVIGQTTISNLFPSDVSPVGETIRIGGVDFKVIGTLQKYGGSAGFGQDQDDIIVVPITAVWNHLESERTASGDMPVNQIYIQAANVATVDDIVNTATQLIREQHKIKPGKDDDFQVTAQKDVLASFDSIIGILTVFLAVVGGISLIVGGIGVMNIMLVTVTERTREVGLRKAVGARSLDVLLQFLIESVVLSSVGGLAGLTLAFAITVVLRLVIPTLDTVVSLPSIALAVGVTSLVGIFFGLYPASRAAALSPIQALRTE